MNAPHLSDQALLPSIFWTLLDFDFQFRQLCTFFVNFLSFQYKGVHALYIVYLQVSSRKVYVSSRFRLKTIKFFLA